MIHIYIYIKFIKFSYHIVTSCLVKYTIRKIKSSTHKQAKINMQLISMQLVSIFDTIT